tara:strand:+ start:260 stop:451 length:192 start_codon:yes stop_codon:yes gene_type:complete
MVLQRESMGQCFPKKKKSVEEYVTFKEFCKEQDSELYEWSKENVCDSDVNSSVFMVGTNRFYV